MDTAKSEEQFVLPRLGYVPALDGLRGVAILWVMLFHMEVVPAVGSAARGWQALAGRGGLGVDVFFVLSGFLITGILLDSKGWPGYLRNFYARRMLRIFPLYYAVLFCSFVVLPRVTQIHAAKFQLATQDSIWYWLHLSNVAIAHRGAFVHGVLDVSWSLSIEEQFYLVWPVVVLLTSARSLGCVCVALVALSCISRITLTSGGANPVAVYTLTFCRLDGLAIGALTALAIRLLTPEQVRRGLPILSVGAIALTTLTFLESSSTHIKLLDIGLVFTAVSLLTACVILTCLTSASSTLVAILSTSPLRTLGRFSYAMYLFHYPLMAALRDMVWKPAHLPTLWGSSLPSQLAFDLVSVLVTLLAALVSWHAYEKWFLRLKRYF